MIKGLTFAKLANKWFAVIPEWEGDVEDLQMVCGADLMLDTIAKGDSIVHVNISDQHLNTSETYKLTLIEYDDQGGTYEVDNKNFFGSVWLCNVTKYVLGDFLPYIYIRRT